MLEETGCGLLSNARSEEGGTSWGWTGYMLNCDEPLRAGQNTCLDFECPPRSLVLVPKGGAVGKWWALHEVGPCWRSLGHWGSALKGTVAPSVCSHEVSTFVPLCTPAMIATSKTKAKQAFFLYKLVNTSGFILVTES